MIVPKKILVNVYQRYVKWYVTHLYHVVMYNVYLQNHVDHVVNEYKKIAYQKISNTC